MAAADTAPEGASAAAETAAAPGFDPGDAPAVVDSLFQIKEGDTVLFRGANDWTRIVDAKRGVTIRAGRFVVPLDPVLGQRYGTVFEVQDGALVPLDDVELIPAEEDEAPSVDKVANNTANATFGLASGAQKLGEDEVHELKQQQKGEEVVSTLAENNDTFKRRTEFSRAKYLKRKRKKHLARVQALRVTPTALAEQTFVKAPQKLCHMRWDTLGQLVARADIQAGSRPLVVEQTGGALTGMVLQRLGGQGVCFHAYEGAGAPVGNARRAVRKEWVRDTLRTFPVTWVAGALERRRRVNAREYAYVRALIASRHGAAGAAEEKAKNEEGAKEEEEEAKEDASKPAAKRRRIPPAERAGGGVEEEEEGEMDATGSGNADAGGVTAAGEAPESGSGEGEGGEEGESDGEDEPYRGEEEALAELRNAMRSQNEREMSDEARSALKGRRRTALEWGLAHGATNLVACVQTDVMPVLQSMLPLVRPGGTIAVCTQYVETLMDAQQWLQESKLGLDVTTSEFWTREYQVLPGRTHPRMNMPAHSGYLLTAIKGAEADAPCGGPPKLSEREESLVDAVMRTETDSQRKRHKKNQALSKRRKGQRVSLAITAKR